ncbi:MAG: 2-oxoacid:acceptor oxidoreductase subunit alpha [Firmicutes bacterium]|jgi:2-oxoglutarate ferredoxin oxidoreductase subunit alpha|nr:2-oxoacid:acceptor oxidoreductase subunit alpha [Bacillota bacterium]
MAREPDVRYLQGNEAIAEGAFAAGARFFAGYPITPSSEIAEIASRRLLELGGVYLQMEDELASMAAVIGASFAGVKSFTATSGPGFSLMQENLGLAVMTETPCVVVNIQRSGPSTGLATKPAQADVMQARWGTHGDHAAIALCPCSVQECYDLTVMAFNYAERFRTPVVLLADEIVGHMREKVVLGGPRGVEVVDRRRYSGEPEGYMPYLAGEDGVPAFAAPGGPSLGRANSSMHDETGFANNTPENATAVIRRLHDKVYNARSEICHVKEYMTGDCDIVLISYGATSRAARAAAMRAREKGLRAGCLTLTTIWPFPDEAVARVCRRAERVIVPEMNTGQLIGEVRRAACRPDVVGLNKFNGLGIDPGEILRKIEEVRT